MLKKDYYKNVGRVLLIVLVLNWAVALAKIVFGLIARSSGMTADGFHSFSDGASNIVGLTGILIASRPRDTDHPYGHKKYETFFSLGIAFLLGIVSFELIREGVRRLYDPVMPDITIVSFAVMVVTLCVNIFVMFYERREGKLIRSDILMADSTHTRADILTSISVIASFFAIKAGLLVVDALVTLFIALFIIYSIYEIIRDSARVLCDGIMVADVKKIENIVLTTNGTISCHKIRSRGRPDDINIDLHVQVPSDMSVTEAHRVSYEIEGRIKKAIPEITDIVIHIEPKDK